MFKSTRINLYGAVLLSALMCSTPLDAVMKKMEVKGKISTAGHTVSYGKGANALYGGGSDSVYLLDTDLDFRMKLSQGVSARIDLELDNATAGDTYFVGKSLSTSRKAGGNRYAFGVDQAFFKMSDFLFKNFSLSIGKQNLNFSLRNNKSFSWAYGDPMSVVGTYSSLNNKIKFYWAKSKDSSTLKGGTNDTDKGFLGIYAEHFLNEDSLVIAYLNQASNNSSNLDITHYGLGVDYFVGDSIELYGEVAGQSLDDSGSSSSAYQVNLGLEYIFREVNTKPSLNIDYYLQSGKGSGTDRAFTSFAGGAAGADNQALFIENNGSAAGFRDESPYGVGLVDFGGSRGRSVEGYSVLRLNGSLSPSSSTKVGFGLHLFTNEDDAAGQAGTDDLGMELDLTGSWKYSQDITFRTGAFLWQGADDLFSGSGEFEDVKGVSLSSRLTF